MLYVFLSVIPRRLNFICRSFGTLSVPSSQAGMYEESPDLGNVGVFMREKFELANSFSRINTPTFLKSSDSSYLPAYEMEQTVCRNVGI